MQRLSTVRTTADLNSFGGTIQLTFRAAQMISNATSACLMLRSIAEKRCVESKCQNNPTNIAAAMTAHAVHSRIASFFLTLIATTANANPWTETHHEMPKLINGTMQ